MIVDLISFSFKKNNIPNANYLFDVRFLNNPFYVEELKPLSGLDKEVIKFFEEDKDTEIFLKNFLSWIEFIIDANKKRNKEEISIAIGCTGGQHRSPYITEQLAKYLTEKCLISELSIYHNELKKYNVAVPSN